MDRNVWNFFFGRSKKFSADGQEGEYDGLRAIENRTEHFAMLTEGAKRYSFINQLIPKKPENSIAYPNCNGDMGIFNEKGIICECGNIGWVQSKDV